MKKYTLFALFIILTVSCSKPPGEGGTSTIKGKIYVRDYNVNFTILEGQYFAPEERVYIIYGDEGAFYDDEIRTSYDGSFEFRNLRPGKYSVFAYSDDSTFTAPSGVIPVIKNVEITGENQIVDVSNIVVLK